MKIFVSDWPAFHADRTPERVALIDEGSGRRITYGELNDRAGRLAAYLHDQWGVTRGDRVAILGKNSTEYFELQFACWKLGAMMLPLNWRLTNPELLFILNDCSPVALVYDSEFVPRIHDLFENSPLRYGLRLDHAEESPAGVHIGYEQAILHTTDHAQMPPDLWHDDPAIIMYTAGTTGHPKGALITHQMMLYNALNISTPTGLNCESVQYSVLPTFHIGGLNLYVNPIIHHGGAAIIARDYDPGRALDALSDPALRVTHFFGVPANYLFMAQHPAFNTTDLRGVVSWGCGGAPMPVPLLQQYAQRGIVVQLGFGMTETSPTVFLIDKRRSLEKPVSVGKPLQHTRVRVVREDFSDVQPGEMGEVVITGPNITPGYWNRPEATEDSFTEDEYGQRWLHSGDAGTVDEEGCIYIVDRYKDMYLSGGENVYPAEVEQVIFQLPQVADVAVIGVPHERWGETGMAILVLHPDQQLGSNAVIEHCKQNLAKYKVPAYVRYINALPRNAAGKVLKRVLREQYSQGTVEQQAVSGEPRAADGI
jgi:fatty-acyl-CoA synthase